MNPLKLLDLALQKHNGNIRLACSFGAEDMVLVDMLAQIVDRPPVFTLDTGRLPPQTYDLIAYVEQLYRLDLKVYFPEAGAVEHMISERGINLFYKSIEDRKCCCGVRKVEPLKRALADLEAWIAGLRREQAPTRKTVEQVESEHGLVKYNPLADWSEEQVWTYIRAREVPYNALHNQGYRTIGCAPCTRAVEAGEDPRAGRWWWESDEADKECGCHSKESE